MPAKGQEVKQSVKDYLSNKYKGIGNPNWKNGSSTYVYKGRKAWNKGTKGICKPNKTSFKKGQRPSNYQGGLSFYNGRWVIVCRNDKKYAYARAVMECALRRKLTRKDIVHHINEDPKDDRIENLELTNRSEHMEIHRNQLLKARKENYVRKIEKTRISNTK